MFADLEPLRTGPERRYRKALNQPLSVSVTHLITTFGTASIRQGTPESEPELPSGYHA